MKLSICTEWLFFHLWKKNPETGKSCAGLVVPDTIIYRYLPNPNPFPTPPSPPHPPNSPNSKVGLNLTSGTSPPKTAN